MQLSGRLADVPPGGEESREQSLPLPQGRAIAPAPLAQQLRQVREGDLQAGVVDEDGFQEVLQLPDVARPVVLEEALQGGIGEALDLDPEAAAQFPDVVVQQCGNVFLSLAQWGQV